MAGIAHPGFRTALLGRELLNKRGRQVEVRIGAPVPPDKLLAIPTAREQADYLRWRTYLLASRAILFHLTRLGIALTAVGDHGELFALALVVVACSLGLLLLHRQELPWIGRTFSTT